MNELTIEQLLEILKAFQEAQTKTKNPTTISHLERAVEKLIDVIVIRVILSKTDTLLP